MQYSFTIEVLSPGGIQWQFYESLEDTLAGLLTHVYCVRKAFPSCAVRAIDMATGQVVNLIRGTYADE